jgi:hypothetical protein
LIPVHAMGVQLNILVLFINNYISAEFWLLIPDILIMKHQKPPSNMIFDGGFCYFLRMANEIYTNLLHVYFTILTTKITHLLTTSFMGSSPKAIPDYLILTSIIF